MKKSIFWFRRDLRMTDNRGFQKALAGSNPVIPIFIFDSVILNELDRDDPRLTFIYQSLKTLHQALLEKGSALKVYHGKPIDIWKSIISEFEIERVYCNKDYEPYSRKRDDEVEKLLIEHQIKFLSYKDQVIFEEHEIIKNDGKPYSVFTPYMRKWWEAYHQNDTSIIKMDNWNRLYSYKTVFPSLSSIGFTYSNIAVKNYSLSNLEDYSENKDYPSIDQTSYLSTHLRFGTIGIRELFHQIKEAPKSFLNELIWREFFMQILFHYPQVVMQNFKPKYDRIRWRNHPEEFQKWCDGNTGYPMVDAGMRQLNSTGFMHNRVRMITAGFLCKHLLIDWRWGESYFAKNLLDYELSSNNGNWQWAAGTGCDAAPYFRIFNPLEQQKKFDKDFKYIRKWIPNFDDYSKLKPIVEHKQARERALKTYKNGLLFN